MARNSFAIRNQLNIFMANGAVHVVPDWKEDDV